MLSEKMEKALNEQVNREYFSAYLYLSMVAYFESLNLPGFALWMRAQTQEEMFHGTKIYDHINERGGRVLLKAIDGPETVWASPLAAFDAALAHEQFISGCINDLVTAARGENDHASDIFLQWFVTEQVEEEQSVGNVAQQLKLVGDSPDALLMIDRELAARVFTMPSAE
ncbi:ferritin [Candidatus Latescibacterota bacterium]